MLRVVNCAHGQSIKLVHEPNVNTRNAVRRVMKNPLMFPLDEFHKHLKANAGKIHIKHLS